MQGLKLKGAPSAWQLDAKRSYSKFHAGCGLRRAGDRPPRQRRCQSGQPDEAPTLQRQAQELKLPLESALPGSGSGSAPASGPRSAPRLAPGTLLKSRYRVEEALGTGSNATTYRAVDTATGSDVAVKALSLVGLRDWKQLELFQREAQVLQSLDHPGIPRYLDYFEEDSDQDRSFLLVQEVAQGKSLAQMVSGGMRASEAEVLRIARELLRILQYLGSLRPPVIHRDIKPENIVLEGGQWGGRVFLIDFGGVQGAATAGDVLGVASTIVGTYGYMAPEQFRGAATPSSDLYSLGGTLLYLVSGQPPFAFPQERMRVAFQDRVTVGRDLGQLLDGLLEPQVEDRLSAIEALDIISGKAKARARKARQAAGQAAPQASALLLPDGRVLNVPPQLPAAGRVRKPAGSRVQLSKSGGRLDIEIPPEGLSGASVSTGVFAVVWNAFVAFWTVSALASGGLVFALFSAPFWFAGWQLAGQAFGGALMRERLVIGLKNFRLGQELAVLKDGAARFLGQNARTSEGAVEDLAGARIVTTVVVNGVPRTAIELVEGVNKYRFGEGLQGPEQQWLVSEINGHLAAARGGAAPTEADLGPVEMPTVYDDTGSDGFSNRNDPFLGIGAREADPFPERDALWDERQR